MFVLFLENALSSIRTHMTAFVFEKKQGSVQAWVQTVFDTTANIMH